MGTAITLLVVITAVVTSLAFAVVTMKFLLIATFHPEGPVRGIAKLLGF